jgi:hypothetical protein
MFARRKLSPKSGELTLERFELLRNESTHYRGNAFDHSIHSLVDVSARRWPCVSFGLVGHHTLPDSWSL